MPHGIFDTEALAKERTTRLSRPILRWRTEDMASRSLAMDGWERGLSPGRATPGHVRDTAPLAFSFLSTWGKSRLLSHSLCRPRPYHSSLLHTRHPPLGTARPPPSHTLNPPHHTPLHIQLHDVMERSSPEKRGNYSPRALSSPPGPVLGGGSLHRPRLTFSLAPHHVHSGTER